MEEVGGNRENVMPDDPLDEWVRHVEKAKSRSESGLKALLAECTTRFHRDKRYRNDERYLKLWLSYADLTDDPGKVFLLLQCQRIGTRLALFWAAWSYAAEMEDNYSEAARLLDEGNARFAVPASLLEECKRAFIQRMDDRMRLATKISGGIAGGSKGEVRSTEQERELSDDTTAPLSMNSLCEPCSTASGRPPQAPVQHMLIAPCIGVEKSDQRKHAPRRLEEERCKTLGDLSKAKDQAQTALPNSLGWAPGISSEDEVQDCRPLHSHTVKRRSRSLHRQGVEGGGNERRKQRHCFEGSPGSCCRRGPDSPCARFSPDDREVMDGITFIHSPFCKERRSTYTTATDKFQWWASSSKLVHDLSADVLGKNWPRKMVRRGPSSVKGGGVVRKLGSERVKVLGVLGEGAFAVVYFCRRLDDGEELAVKIERPAESLPWECFITLQLRQRLRHIRDKGGHMSLHLIKTIPPQSLLVFRDGCAITMHKGPMGTLHDVVEAYTKRSQTMPELVAMHYTIEMLRFVRAVHTGSMLHMDIKPDNWLLTERQPSRSSSKGNEQSLPDCINHTLSLIDFGRAIDLGVFPKNGKGTAFTGNCCPPSFARPSMIQGLPWKHDADLFALGSCIHFMLHGTYMEALFIHEGLEGATTPTEPEGRWRPAKPCRRYWQVKLWETLFDELLNFDWREGDQEGTAVLLEKLQQTFLDYVYGCPLRLRDLQELLRLQNNMILHR
ncbi:unnamed protein product [Discosporangium mesarthrocarpum]